MRGRIRQLKPDVFLDEELWALIDAHPDLHLLQAFEGLWCQADREGRFEWRAAMLKTQILPYWGGDFARCLEVLRGAGFIRRYDADGRTYGEIRSFLRHQRPNNREPESVIPRPLEHAEAGELERSEAGPLKSAEAGVAHPLEPAGFSPARVPTPTPTPNPYSQPQPARADSSSPAPDGAGTRRPCWWSYPPGWRWSPGTEAAALAQGVTSEGLAEHVAYWTTHEFARPVTDLDAETVRSLPAIRKRRETEAFKAAQTPRAGPQRGNSDALEYAFQLGRGETP